MSLSPGTRIGPYEVVSLLGVGGMGEVLRGRDTKLNRDVALKVLPDLVAADPDRLARFRREAQVLAAINHTNIAHIHGFEDSGAVHAIVMELVEGPTLAQLIGDNGHSAPAARPERGAERAEAERMGVGPHSQLSIDDAISIARQMAEALKPRMSRASSIATSSPPTSKCAKTAW